MAETAAQRRKRLADELERLEAEGNEGAGKLRESLEHLDKREAAKRGEDPHDLERRLHREPPKLLDAPESVDNARGHLDYAWPKRAGK